MPNFEQTRFMQGDMGRKLDDAQDHSDIAPRNPKTPGDKALHRAWYKDPGSADIKGIDDQGTLPPKDPKQPKQPKQPDQPKTKTDKNTLYVDEGNGSIWAGTGGNKKQREELAAKATKNFSKAERKAFNRVVIEIAKSYAAKRGASGYYQSDAWMPKNKTVEKALVNWPGSKTPAPKISKELQTKFDNQTRYVVNVAKGPPSKGHKVHQTFFRFTTGIDGMSARNRAEAQLKQLKKEGWQGFVTTPQDKSAQLTAAEESQYQDYKKSQRRPSTKHHYIRMGSGYLDGDIITHELVHHVRMGRSADRQSGHIKRYTGKDKDSEESSTELETTARHDPWIQGPKAIDPDKLGNWDMASYYRRISEKKHPYDYSQAARLQQGLNNQDRSIILQGAHNRRLSNAEVNKALDQVQKNPDKYINAGIRDPKISKRIDNRYDQTVIKEMGKNIKGADERIDRYYAALDKSGKAKTKLHIRAAGQGRNKEAAKTVLSKVPGSGTIVEYNDGKAKTIGKFENPKQRNGFTNKRKNRFN